MQPVLVENRKAANVKLRRVADDLVVIRVAPQMGDDCNAGKRARRFINTGKDADISDPVAATQYRFDPQKTRLKWRCL
jgi:hypothetical protein